MANHNCETCRTGVPCETIANKDPEECCSCDFAGAELTFRPPRSPFDDCGCYMCDVCFGSLVGNSYHFPNQYKDRTVLKTIAIVGNMILKAIKEKE